nr:XRE family transcriptional regulator [Sphingomonas paeninsulae]
MGIGKRIAAARDAKGWSQGKLAEAVGKGQTTVSSWERERTEPTREDVVRIASKLGIPLADIEDVLSDKSAPMGRTMPVLSWVSAGHVHDIASVQDLEEVDHITVSSLPPGEYFATKVKGDSMDRVSPEDSTVIVNVKDRDLVSGLSYLFSLRGETTYKMYQGKPVARLEPYSTNPSNKTIFLNGDKDWSVIGRVVRSFIDL